MLNKLPIELNITIYEYLDKLKPFDTTSRKIMQSNIIWKKKIEKEGFTDKSLNYYQEYKWKKKIEKYQFNYKRQWTLGCVGRIMPLTKPLFCKAEKIY